MYFLIWIVTRDSSGKTLCYALPASLLPGLTIVVSPLISLMYDQMKKLPDSLPGFCFGQQQSLSTLETARLVQAVLHKRIKVKYFEDYVLRLSFD